MKRATLRGTRELVTAFALATTAVLTMGACDPGSYEDGPPDAAVQVQQPDAAPLPDAAATCDEPSTLQIDGRHNAGQACQTCHFTGVAGAPNFTFAGTMYATRDGGQGVVGATIHITDANGMEDTIITGSYGNFYSKKTYAYPIKVTASSCPDTAPMFTEVPRPGDCNTSGCHTTADVSGRIHLP
jgi:cytochrome c5